MKRFVDEVTVEVEAGHGGKGCVSFRREKFIPRGGPDGGDGGKGGDVYLEGDGQGQSLLDLFYQRLYRVKRGGNGSGSNRHGAASPDLVVRVPLGTEVWDLDRETGERLVKLGEILEHGRRLLVARGGRGGKGNAHFVSSTHRSPRFAQPGEEGESRSLRVVLKVMADAGLVGLPNAGKSTLITALSAARPKIASYPFTTLHPHLGMMPVDGYRQISLADIPGLIADAHRGSGLGTRFLKHVERNRVLVHLVSLRDRTEVDGLLTDYRTVMTELASYRADLPDRVRLVLLSQCDTVTPATAAELTAAMRHRLAAETGGEPREVMAVSAATGAGIEALRRRLIALVDAAAPAPPVFDS
ncbi:MAG: GTPase ObgE [Deltaproteobacteria bacterium]|nr:GTPase ObgE [Candidatus Anaeroferrophillacea bacterium]